jgi:hypothetical protein
MHQAVLLLRKGEKNNAIPVTDHEGPQGREMLGLLHFLDNWLTDGIPVLTQVFN